MSRQMSEDEKIKKCNFVITNDEPFLLTRQVLLIHKTLLEMAAKKATSI
jgi:dephospho-CoA kinase